ncbi:MAG TPA: hypothetical protein DCX07_00635 [Phycisphaerales bacterium]|nr:hypothetical protein [Phycisphaerales bacterium]
MRHLHCLLIALLFILVSAAIAQADDMNSPSYRGQTGYTTQEWDFTTSGDPMFYGVYWNPDGTGGINYNPYGTGIILATVSANSEPGSWQNNVGPSAGGAWTDFASMLFKVPNVPAEPEPSDKYKLLRIQVTFYDANVSYRTPTVAIPASEYETWQQVGSGISHTFGNGWYSYYADWQCDKNVGSEDVYLYNPYGSTETGYADYTVSEVIIDTVCVPEPTTGVVLAVGVVALLFRRHWKRRTA